MSMNDQGSPQALRRNAMLEPDEVTARLRLKKPGWGSEIVSQPVL